MPSKYYPPEHCLHYLMFWRKECTSAVALAPVDTTVNDLKRMVWEEDDELRTYGKGLDYTDLRLWKLKERVSCFPAEDVLQRCEAVATSGDAQLLSPNAKLSEYWSLDHKTGEYVDVHIRFSSKAARRGGLAQPFDIPGFWPSNTNFPASQYGPAFRIEYDTRIHFTSPRVRVAYLLLHPDSALPGDSAEKLVVVKFCSRYGIEAHELLAQEHLAPSIHFFGSLHPYTKFFFVVMECVYPPQGFASVTTLPSIQADICKCVAMLHANDMVHGDIRPGNILLHRPGADSAETICSGEINAMLVDFDWAGREGEVMYPRDINTLLVSWPEGVKPGAPIQKEHDTTMLNWIDWDEVQMTIQRGAPVPENRDSRQSL